MTKDQDKGPAQARPRPKSTLGLVGLKRGEGADKASAVAQPCDLPPWLAPQLAQLAQRSGHAWLLHGAAGLGQWPLALALARAWLCEGNKHDGIACGHCPSCHAIDVRTHADLCVVMPEEQMLAAGWPLDAKAQAELDEKKRKPSREIRVEALRAAIAFSQRTNARGRGKVVLIYPAERMNTIAANALLKTLEEPPGDLRLVLASDNARALLPTIRSRCQAHAMAWPAADVASAWLGSQGVPSDEAAAWLALAAGLPEAARELHAQLSAAQLRLADALALPAQVAQGQAEGFFNAIQSATGPAAPAQWVAWLQKICQDLLRLHCGGAPRYFRREDLPAQLPPLAVLSRWARALGQAARTATHPFNATLMAQALLAQARAVLNSRAR